MDRNNIPPDADVFGTVGGIAVCEGKEEGFEQGILRLSTFPAEMMEKYGVQVMRDIAVEIQYEPETWHDDAEGKRLRCEAYARRFTNRYIRAA